MSAGSNLFHLRRTLAEARLRSGRTLKDVGDAVGISGNAIGQLEKMQTMPSTITLAAWAWALGYELKLVERSETEGKNAP